MTRYFKAEIVENRPVRRELSLLTILPLAQTEEPGPGQFYMVSASPEETAVSPHREGETKTYDPLLKRPFSLFRKTGKWLQIFYRVKGRGTSMIRAMKEGSVISVLGPLGNAYPESSDDETPVILAGGIGMASIFYLAERLAARKRPATVIYGARTAEEIVFTDELQGFAGELIICTDDGTRGEKGTAVDMLNRYADRRHASHHRCCIYACGPRPMLKALAQTSRERGIDAYLSMEEYMACGLGACLSCVVKTTTGYKRACKEGPIFAAEELVWE